MNTVTSSLEITNALNVRSLLPTLDSRVAHKIEIGVATTKDELDECYRIRHQVYVLDEGIPLCEGHASDNRVIDEADETGIVLYAKIGGKIIGTTRVNIGYQKWKLYRDIFSLSQLEGYFADSVAVLSRMAVLKDYRASGRTFLELSKASYRLALEMGANVSILGCKSELISMYEKLGFAQYKNGVAVPGYGTLLPLILHNYDEERLTKSRSPWLPVLKAHQMGNQQEQCKPVA